MKFSRLKSQWDLGLVQLSSTCLNACPRWWRLGFIGHFPSPEGALRVRATNSCAAAAVQHSEARGPD
eukprot:3759833-Lingulodinium_polyedra.AAC.1